MLVDDLRMPLTRKDLDRRKFLGLLGSGCLAAACAGTCAAVGQFLRPNVLFEEPSRAKLVRPDEIEPGSVLVIPSRKLFLVRGATGIYALSSVCTHLGCVTNYDKAAGKIRCPCHGSRFDLQGSVIGGPAPRPLQRLELSLERGLLIVDTSKVVASDWVLKLPPEGAGGHA